MENTRQILFGGGRMLPPKKAEFKKPEFNDRPLYINLIEEAFQKLTSTDDGKKLYGDLDKGATIEQAWKTTGLLAGKLPVCILSTEQPQVETAAIDRVIKMRSKDLIDVLIDMFSMNKNIAYQTFYYDGNIGHSIVLTNYNDTSMRFTYDDPWPNYSLLCKDYNAAGVDAQPSNEGWSITSKELERVIFAVFVGRSLWSEYMEEKYYTTYDEFTSSDFWEFFHLNGIDTKIQDESGNTIVLLKTGGFKEEIDLSITVNQKNRLTEGLLSLKQSWIIGPPYGLNPFALDIVRSFISTLIPPPDQESAADFIKMLYQVQNLNYAKQLIDEGLEKSDLHKFLATYLGALPSFETVFPFSDILVENVVCDTGDCLQIHITTDAL